MSRRVITVALASLACAVVALVLWQTPIAAPEAAPPPPRWEYRVVTAGQGLAESSLNSAGHEGWELVAATASNDLHHGTDYVFKRQK